MRVLRQQGRSQGCRQGVPLLTGGRAGLNCARAAAARAITGPLAGGAAVHRTPLDTCRRHASEVSGRGRGAGTPGCTGHSESAPALSGSHIPAGESAVLSAVKLLRGHRSVPALGGVRPGFERSLDRSTCVPSFVRSPAVLMWSWEFGVDRSALSWWRSMREMGTGQAFSD